MKNTIIISIISSFSSLVYGQVGIHTPNPHPSSDLELGSTNKTLYLNRVANPVTDIANPQPGMILFDTTKKCLRAYQGNPAAWSDCLAGESSNGGIVSNLTCASAAFSPATAIQGQFYNGTLTIPYTGGNGGAYLAQSFTQNGLTFTLPAGSFNAGAGDIVYTVTGTPTTTGTMSVNVTIGGQSCSGLTLTMQSGVGVMPGNVSLAQNRMYFIASVYDQNYLPYTAPSGPASTAVVNADGTNEPVTVNVQGSITTTGVTVQIPIASVTGNGTISAWTSTITVPASLTEDGISRQLQLSWSSQTYTAASTKYITATIKSIGGTLNAKKLDINAGIGNDYLGVLLGAFQYPYNNTGAVTSYQVRDITGIPDRMFGQYDNGGAATGQRHNFLYLPIQGEDGNIWLNNNLGADYANINHSSFNLAQQATSSTDYHAYGSIFQWGRKADGHELMTWTSGTTGTPVNGAITGSYSEPLTTPNYILGAGNGTWRNPPNGTLWSGGNAVNNPCPSGFKIPSESDIRVLGVLYPYPSPPQSFLKFTGTARIGDTIYTSAGLWTSTSGSSSNPNDGTWGSLYDTTLGMGYINPSRGYSLRCVKVF